MQRAAGHRQGQGQGHAHALTCAQVNRAVDTIVRDQNITVILAAHRLSTIAQAERVIVLENGVVSEEGPYSVLVSLCLSSTAWVTPAPPPPPPLPRRLLLVVVLVGFPADQGVFAGFAAPQRRTLHAAGESAKCSESPGADIIIVTKRRLALPLPHGGPAPGRAVWQGPVGRFRICSETSVERIGIRGVSQPYCMYWPAACCGDA